MSRGRATAVLLALASCVAPPSHLASVDGVSIRADSAERAAGILSRWLDELHAILPDVDEGRLKVFVWDDERYLRKYGNPDLDGRITFDVFGGPSSLSVAESSLPQSIVHELVHAMLGPSWRPLPGALEEGLANELGFRAWCEGEPDPEAALQRVRDKWVMISVPRDECKLVIEFDVPAERRRTGHVYFVKELTPYEHVPLAEIMARPRLVRSFNAVRRGEGLFYAMGTLLAGRILDRANGDPRAMHELCVRASAEGLDRVPLTEVLRAAGFSDEAEFDRWRDQRLIAALERHLLEAESLALVVGTVAERLGRPPDLEQFLGELDVTLRRESGGARTHLAERPDLVRLVERTWPGPAPVPDALDAHSAGE